MTKQKILIAIPFLLVAVVLTYCWTTILFTDALALWRHYIGLLLFVPLIVLFFKDTTKATIGLGIYLLLAVFNMLAITPSITIYWINIRSSRLATPPVQLSSLAIFILYFVLNLDSLINIQLDYKDSKLSRIKE